MNRYFLLLLLAGCNGGKPAPAPKDAPDPKGGEPASECKLAGDWSGEFAITNADGLALPAHLQIRLPASLRISDKGAVAITLNGTTLSLEHAGQFVMGNPFGHAHVAMEVAWLDASADKIHLATRSRSGTVQRAPGDRTLNEAEQASEMTFSLVGDRIEVNSIGHTTKPGGVRSTVVMAGTFRRVGGAPVKPPPASVDDWFPMAVGTSWKLRHNGATVTATLAGEETVGPHRAIRQEMSAGGRVTGTEHLIRKEDGVYRVATNGNRFDEPVPVLRLPLKDGDAWDMKVGIGGMSATGRATVTMESVTVPAGKFDAGKVRSEIQDGPTRIISETWYAKGTGIVKMSIRAGAQSLLFERE